MRKYGILIITLILSTSIFSQEEDGYVYGDNTSEAINKSSGGGGFDWSRTTIGGGFGLVFGDYTIIELAPSIGYYVTDNILAGIGGNYTYYNDKYYNFSTSLYGARVFGEYIFENIPFLVHSELELINIENFDGSRLNIINPYIGGGLKQNFGGRSYFYILVLWNLNETKESYYIQPNPIIRGGIAIGL